MKSKLIWILVFIAALFAGDRMLGLLLSSIASASSFRFTQLYEGKVNAEVLILGNSRGVNSFYQPDLTAALSKPAYNLSYNGLRIDLARVLFEDYLALNKKPSVVLLEASMLTQSYPELIKEFKPYITRSNNLGKKMRELYPKVFWTAAVSDLFRYNSETFLRSVYYIRYDDQKWISDGNITAELKAMLPDFTTNFDIDEFLLADVAAIEELCVQQGITFKIILCPYYAGYPEKVLNLEDWKRAINARLKTTSIDDYSGAVSGDENFADWVHLNKKGSTVFLKKLIDENYFSK